MSSNPLNFAPYSSPPSSPSRSTLPRGGTTGNGNAGSSSRPKTPWFTSGSYQSGAKTSDLNSANHISSSSSAYHSAEAGPSSYASQGGQTAISSNDVLWDAENGYAGPSASISGAGGGYSNHDAYETAFGWRVDIEAAAAYLAGPILAILLLVVETKNDYVRFHAWQSLMLGAGLAVLHLILLWSRFFTWVLVLIDLALYGNLAYRAFIGGNNLERYFLPKIGEIAAQWTEEE